MNADVLLRNPMIGFVCCCAAFPEGFSFL